MRDFRPLKDDERTMLRHSSMWGQACFVQRVGSRHWSWSYLSLSAPVVFPTKREAQASCDAFLDVLIDLSGQEAQTRTVRERMARGESKDALARELSSYRPGWPLTAVVAEIDEALSRAVPA